MVPMQLRGVNLGGWLVLERWITPSLFDGFDANDEYSFCLERAPEARERLRRHRETYITKKDFEWLAKHGINAVRVPVGYWALRDDPPFIDCAVQLDLAFDWADEYGLRILLDLHGAPGSQNGQDHSGRAGSTTWTRRSSIQRTLEVIEQLCQRYRRHPALWGIELLNEPGWKIPHRTLRSFYDKGYDIVRRQCGDQVAVVFSDAFKPLTWNKFMADEKYQNILLDTHLYQCFSPFDKALTVQGHLDKTRHDWGSLGEKISRPIIVGEWSLGLDKQAFYGMDERVQHAATKAFADAQLEAFKQTRGWFFWSYKTETMPGWSYIGCVESGLLPAHAASKP